MEPEKKTVLTELPVPDEPEKPEEGFVPYCGSDEAEAGQKAGAGNPDSASLTQKAGTEARHSGNTGDAQTQIRLCN